MQEERSEQTSALTGMADIFLSQETLCRNFVKRYEQREKGTKMNGTGTGYIIQEVPLPELHLVVDGSPNKVNDSYTPSNCTSQIHHSIIRTNLYALD